MQKQTFAVSTLGLAGATTVGSKQLLVVYQPASASKVMKVQRVVVSQQGGSGGIMRLSVYQTTGAPTGGTAQTVTALDTAAGGGNTGLAMSLPTGGSTLGGRIYSIWSNNGNQMAPSIDIGFAQLASFEGKLPTFGIAGQGIAIVEDVDVALTTACTFYVTVWWTEE